MNLQPLEDRIVVKPQDAEATTASGLVIPDTAKEKPQQGEVLAVGTGRRSDSGELIPMDVNAGDTVVYSKYGGTEITIDGDDLLILPAIWRNPLPVLRDARPWLNELQRHAASGARICSVGTGSYY